MTAKVFRCGILGSGFRRLRDEIDVQVRADRERAAQRRAERDRSLEIRRTDAGSTAVVDAAPGAVEPEPVPAAVLASDLALPDYDHLPASQIVAMLDDLASGELALIEAYERANRNRRTVLGKLAQLER